MSAIDVLVLVAYAAAALAIGTFAGRGHGTSSELLLGDRRMPVWAVGLSMVATELSAATFVGVPQAAYRGDWSYLQLAFGALLGKTVVAAFILPGYHARGVTTVYQLLAERYGPACHRAAAICFIVGRLLASGVRLFIAALAFSVASDLRIELAIALCGAVAGLYTSFGGIRAVIYTDVLQAVVLVAGAAAVAVAAVAAAGGPAELAAWASESGRSQIFHLAPWISLSDGRSFGAALAGGFFLTLATHSTDHDMVQRLLTTRDARGAGSALLASALLNFPMTALFLAIGTAIALTHAGTSPPGTGTERVLPEFALHALPAGVRGLVFAGLFAAAMSSLDSAICAISATFAVDVARRPVTAERTRWASGVLSVVLVAIAIGMASYQRATAGHEGGLGLIDLALSSMSILYGGLLGVFLLASFGRRRLDDRAGVAGLVVGALAGAMLFLHPIALDGAVIAWTWWIPISSTLAMATVLGLDRFAPRRR